MYYNGVVRQTLIVRISIPYVHILVHFAVPVKYIRRYFRTFVAMHNRGGMELGTLYERIVTLCKSKGVSGSRMCLDLGLSKSTMSDLKYGRTRGMSTATAQKVAEYFGITTDELLGVDNKKTPTLFESERRIAKDQFFAAFEAADEATREAIRLLLKVQ